MPSQSTKRDQELLESQAAESRAQARARYAARSTPLRRLLTFCFLPAWLVAILVIDRAIADFHDRAIPINVRVDVTELKQEKDRDNKIDKELPSYWIETKDGNVNGQISAIVDTEQSVNSPIKDLKIVLLQNGKEIKTADATDEMGRFTLKDVKSGPYTLVASGRNGFLAYSVHVQKPLVPFEGARNISRPHATFQYVSVLEKTSVAVEIQDQLDDPEDKIDNVADALIVEDEVPIVAEEDLQIDAAAIPPKFRELQRIVKGHLPPDAVLSAVEKNEIPRQLEDEEVKIAGGFQFPLDENDIFSGRVVPPIGNGENVKISNKMNVFLLKDDKELHRVEVMENGEFEFKNPIEPGVYGVVAAGNDGFAALSVNLVAADDQLSTNRQALGKRYVSLPKKQDQPAFNIAIITDPQDLMYCRKTIRELNNEAPFVGSNPATQYADRVSSSSPGVPAVTSGFPPPTSSGFPTTPAASTPITGGGGRFLRRAALIAAIAIPLAVTDRPSVSPFEPN